MFFAIINYQSSSKQFKAKQSKQFRPQGRGPWKSNVVFEKSLKNGRNFLYEPCV